MTFSPMMNNPMMRKAVMVMNNLQSLGFAGYFSKVLDPDNYYTKQEVERLISEIEKSSYLEVDELPAVGEPNIIYLVPKQGGGKEQWIYSNGTWINIGNTDVDLSEYVKKTEVVDMMYPVGSTLIRTDAVDPATMYEGTTWVKISEGRMLIGANKSYTLGSTGGSANPVLPEHQHTTARHRHAAPPSPEKEERRFLTFTNYNTATGEPIGINQDIGSDITGGGWLYPRVTAVDEMGAFAGAIYTDYAAGANTTKTGVVNIKDKNLPPYLAVNIWQRTE